MARFPENHQKLRDMQGTGSSSEPLEGISPGDILILDWNTNLGFFNIFSFPEKNEYGLF